MACILTISSHVARGHVGNIAATTVLEALGHAVWQIPTITLSNHKGYRHCAGAALPTGMINDMIEALNKNGWLGEIDAVLSGYITSADQVAEIYDAVDAVKTANNKALYWCDPILGDHPGGLYVPDAVAQAIADKLIPRADGISPNAFELGWLAGKHVSNVTSTVDAARTLPDMTKMVTSVPVGQTELANLLVSPDQAHAISHKRFDQVPHGTGDVFTAAALGHLLSKNTQADLDKSQQQTAFQAASNSIFSLAQNTVGDEELDTESIIRSICAPEISLPITRL